MTDLEAAFLFHWRLLAPDAPEPVREYRFCDRRYRFDFSWLESMVAVECEGGIYSRGRHVRGNGYAEDCRKYNLAASLGWRVFRCTAGMLERDPAAFVEIVLKVMQGADNEINGRNSNKA